MNITITGVFEALDLVAQKTNHYRVLSIASKKSVTRLMIKDLKEVKELLVLEFDDATPDELPGYDLATRKQCKEALDFLSVGGDCIVHCHAGVSRSTAITLGYFLTVFDYETAVKRLFELRPCAQPNPHVVRIMCDILQKEYQKVIDSINKCL